MPNPEKHCFRSDTWQLTVLKKLPCRMTYAAPVMLSKLPNGALMRSGFHPQETQWSCTEACRKMSLLFYNIAAAASHAMLTLRTVTKP